MIQSRTNSKRLATRARTALSARSLPSRKPADRAVRCPRSTELTYPGATVFFDLLMDRARGLRNSAVVLFVVALAVTMLAGAILMLLPAMWKLTAVLLSLIPIAITIC